MDLASMDAQIRLRIALAGAVLFVAAEFAMAPTTAIDLISNGHWEHRLSWGFLVAGFTVVAVLLEGSQLGRNTRHRSKVNLAITEYIVTAICSRTDCPEQAAPSDSIRDGAMDVFYSEIDQASRNVAFSQWAWYYTSVYWIAQSALALLVALSYSLATSTDRDAVRWGSMAFLVFAVIYSLAINKMWRQKTMKLAQAQLRQIRPHLPTKFPDAQCRNPACLAT